MPASEQGVNLDRYMVVPRTLIFLTRGEKVLLLKGAQNKRLWAGLYNGIGGHVEKGEHPLSAAQRELFEETGLSSPSLLLYGIVTVDTQVNPGVCIFIFRGESSQRELKSSKEGTLEWINSTEINNIQCIPDLPVLLPKILNHQFGSPPFFAHTSYDGDGKMVMNFV
jgi:8-oxo-dGTP diphosphatase